MHNAEELFQRSKMVGDETGCLEAALIKNVALSSDMLQMTKTRMLGLNETAMLLGSVDAKHEAIIFFGVRLTIMTLRMKLGLE